MACDDRQLTEAQRQAGFNQQRTGVMRAVRPFTGAPTMENLLDYINRELYPAVKASRDKVNDVYLQVTDNAPSANPLGYYFSEDTTNGDPTGGRIRLDSATQNAATTVRVSQVNGRSEDVLAWLDVMNGGVTSPLGVITLFDAINPARFLRFDLTAMVDQGTYWDLTVSAVESSHDNPFVEDEAIVISFIAGVASSGTTVPPSGITPIAADTFLGNITTLTAAPVAVPLADVDSSSVVYDAASHTFQRGALTGFAAAAQNSNATTSAEPIVTFSASANMSNERVLSAGTRTAIDIATVGEVQVDWTGIPTFQGGVFQIDALAYGATSSTSIITNGFVSGPTGWDWLFERAALTGAVTAAQNSNATVFGVPASGAGLTGGGTAILAVGQGTGITVNADDVAVTTPLTDGDKGDITVATNGTVWTIDNGVVTNTKLANMTAGTVKGLQIDAATGAPVDLTGLEVAELIRFGTTQSETLAATTNDLTLNADTTVLRFTLTGSQTLTGITGGAQGRLLFVENISGGGNDLTVASLSASSLTANRIRTPNGVDLVLKFRESAILRWETNNNDWRVVSTARATAIAAGDYGDITVTAAGATWTIDNDVVTNAKLANMATQTFKGRTTAGTGDPEDLSASQAAGILVGQFPPNSAEFVTYSANATLTAERVTTSSTTVTVSTSVANQIEFQRAALTGAITATANSNATLFDTNASGAGLTGGGTAVLAVGAGTGITVNANDVAVTIPLTDGDKGHIVVSSSGATWLWDTTVAITGAQVISTTTDLTLSVGEDFFCTAVNDVVINAGDTAGGVAIHAGLTPKTGANDNRVTITADDQVILEPTGSLRLFSGGTERVEYEATGAWQINGAVGTVGHTIVTAGAGATPAWGQLPTAGIADAAVTLAKQANLAAGTVIGRQVDAGTGVPVALTGLEVGELIRLGTVQNEAIAATTNDLTLNADTTTLRLTPTGTQTLTGITGGSTGRVITVENVAGSGNSIVLASLSASSLTANRLRTPRALDITLGFRESVFLRWDNVNGDWRVIYLGVPLADGDKGDITLTSGATVWTIDNGAVTDAKLVDMAQSRIKGRAEGAGTGDPTDLTPTQVVAIIDAESPTWTGSHAFTGSGSFTVDLTSDVSIASGSGGLWLSSGHTAVTSPSVSNGDVVVNATSGVAINAGATPVASAADGNVVLTADTAIVLDSPVTLSDQIRFTSILTSSMTGNIDNLDATNMNVVRLTPDAGARRLRGMVAGPSSLARSGHLVVIVNGSSTFSFNIVDESDTIDGTSSTAANRFRLPSTTTQTLPANGCVFMWYDSANDRWRMVI